MDAFCRRFLELYERLSLENFAGQALFFPDLDELAQSASQLISSPQNNAADPKLILHVATYVLSWGGHTRVLEDVVTALPEYRHVLVVEHMRPNDREIAMLKPRFEELGLSLQFIKSPHTLDRTKELASLVSRLRPRAIFFFGHDPVTTLAINGGSAQRVIYMHHVDYNPTLGASRTDYAHIDLTPACHSVCAARRDIRASFLNLTVKNVGAVRTAGRNPMIGATCGSAYKYAGVAEFSYAQLLAGLFSAGVASVFHIGDMPHSQRDQIRADISAQGHDAGRVVFLPNTPSLAEKLIDLAPDFYMTSHPLGGGKATVEALSVGLPILYVCPATTPLLLNADMTFGTSVPLTTLEGIPSAVRRLRTEKSALERCSREVYAQRYSTEIFRAGLLQAIAVHQ